MRTNSFLIKTYPNCCLSLCCARPHCTSNTNSLSDTATRPPPCLFFHKRQNPIANAYHAYLQLGWVHMQRDLFVGEAQLFHTPQNFRIQLGVLLLLRLQPILALQQLTMSYYIGKLVQEPLVNACHLAYLLDAKHFWLERRGEHKYLSPVCMLNESMFSMLHTVMQLSKLSRIPLRAIFLSNPFVV